jgi:dolichyl-phosphate-mannose-protein mannosyltransferase
VFSGWDDDKLRVYLLGNPINYAICLVSLVLFPLFLTIVYVARARAVSVGPSTDTRIDGLAPGLWIYIAWAVHYFPFFFMSRVLYFHHYLPAFLLSTIVTSILVVHMVWHFPKPAALIHFQITALDKRSPGLFRKLYAALVVVLMIGFHMFSGLSYGMVGPLWRYRPLKWLSSWEFAP